jgi:hypothetical protein
MIMSIKDKAGNKKRDLIINIRLLNENEIGKSSAVEREE